MLSDSDQEDARAYGGYNGGGGGGGGGNNRQRPRQQLLLWKGAAQPGLVLRYLHYFSAADSLSAAEVEEARAERELLARLDGTRTTLEECRRGIPGIGQIEYF